MTSYDDQRGVIDALAQAQRDGVPVGLATVIETSGSMPRHAGSKMLVYGDGQTVGTVGGGAMEALVIEAAQSALADSKTRIESYTLNSLDSGDPGICGGTARVFIEPVGVAPTLLVIGGGHVGVALCELGKWAGYRVILCDDRSEYANADVVPGMDDYVACPPGEIAKCVEVNAQTYVAAVTRGLTVDVDLIPPLLQTSAAYIGLIGSRRRWELTATALRERGISEDNITRVRSPIGLEVEAETPKEIALSILAEIVTVRRGGTGVSMSKARASDIIKNTENHA